MATTTLHGTFVWYELMTTDPPAAESFYSDVVGWGTTPFEGAQIPYTMWLKDETPIGGLVRIPEGEQANGVTPNWMAHVAVDDVDATAARAKELGGEVLMGPEDIPNIGRYAVLRDPQGAVISTFRGTEEMSGTPEQEPGDVSWHELATTDHESAFRFYSELFGWEKQEAMDMGEAGVYQMYGLDGHMLGGMYNKSANLPDADRNKPQPGPPAWLYYIRVADLDDSVRKVRERGGEIVVEPMEVPGGSRIAVGIDPQGAAFGLHQGA